MGNQSLRMLEFEKPVIELEARIENLKRGGLSETSDEITRLKERLSSLEERIYGNLSPWEKVQLARHPMRPTTRNLVDLICDEFQELKGDRCFADDQAIIGGLARIDESRLLIMGHEKGRSTREKLEHNFGMARPEGFRKALRLMRMADKFHLPIVSIIDTPGAYPGVGAEERGQPQAIAQNLKDIFQIRTPIVVVIIGEGGSGGALAMAIGDSVLMMEHAIYTVISPEGCAAILWKSRERAPEAAASLRLTANDCLSMGVVDRVIKEVHGASHRDPGGNAERIKDAILPELETLTAMEIDSLLAERTKKYCSMGIFDKR